MASPGPGQPPKPHKPTLGTGASDRNSKLAALLQNIDADLGFTKKTPAPASEDSGVNSFRRAKFFFPKLLEEQRKAAEAEKEAAAAARKAKNKTTTRTDTAGRSDPRDTKDAISRDHSPSTPDRRPKHETKRRKVSHESPAGERTPSPSPKSSPGSGGRRTRNGRHGRAAIASASPRSDSGSPPPRTRLDKGKGVATAHSVNADVAFTRGSPAATPLSPGATRRTTRSTKDDSVVVIDSDSEGDSDLDLAPYQPRGKRSARRIEDDEDDNVHNNAQDDDGDLEIIDPEFAEYIMRARDKAKAQRADVDVPGDMNGAAAAATTTRAPSTSQGTTASMARTGSSLTLSGDLATITPTTDSPSASSAPAPAAVAAEAAPPSQPQPGDHQYRVFITSHFPQEVPPLLARVRMDQMMRYVKDAYIGHASKHGVSLTDDQAQSVLLTWKGSKIYNFTTGLSLGIKPDPKGRFRDAHSISSSGDFGGAGGSSAGFMSGGLHLEIWTEDLYEAYLQEEDKRRRRNLGEVIEEDLLSDDEIGTSGEAYDASQGGGGSGGGGAGSGAASQSSRIRLVLKSRDHEKLKITTYNDTTMETLATAFRLQREIGPDKNVVIMWDGDELEGSMTVGEAEMEDMDSIEVHIR
ncbi:hypothetical protein SCUCBS95973_009517 [Sporothrix curviconia]|uniref:Ubiquitin-like domain-containing protein n=1 Tax=Sporothrix curviconia TaxID=1260050 RepID=A0ABP0CW70_9PEZI